MTRNGTPVQVQLTPEQAELLRQRYQNQDAGAALVKLLMAAAGVWVLGEMIRDASEEKPKRRRSRG